MAYQRCLAAGGGAFDVPYGVDEWLLAALALGARGAVGSTYAFAAPIYRRLLRAFAAGDLDSARREQHRAAELVHRLAGYGYMEAARAVMSMQGVSVGPPRLPHGRLTGEQVEGLRRDLETLGFFEWLRP
jgi:N-acetylneuraminate lyase